MFSKKIENLLRKYQVMISYVLFYLTVFGECISYTASTEYNYIGCYNAKKGGITISGPVTNTADFQSVQNCTNFCFTKNYEIAGLWCSTYCGCGQTEDLDEHFQLTDSRCDVFGNGQTNTACGDNWEISVYRKLDNFTESSSVTIKDMQTTKMAPHSPTPRVEAQSTTESIYTVETEYQGQTQSPSGKPHTTTSETNNSHSGFGTTNTNIYHPSREETGTLTSTIENPPSTMVDLCECPCQPTSKWDKILQSNLSKSQIQSLIEDEVKQIQKELTVDKTTTSAYTRRKSSARDSRESSLSIGVAGIVIITFVSLFIICLDCISVYQRVAR